MTGLESRLSSELAAAVKETLPEKNSRLVAVWEERNKTIAPALKVPFFITWRLQDRALIG